MVHRAARRSDVTAAQSDETQPPLGPDGEPDYAALLTHEPLEVEEVEGEEKVVHFLEDGFHALGQQWYRGQELHVQPGTAQWAQVHNSQGKSWMDDDKWTQTQKYGQQMFDQGPWRGLGYDLDDPNLTEQERLELIRKTSGRTKANGPGLTYKKRPSFISKKE